MVLKLIRKALNRVARLFSSRERATVEEVRAEKPPSGILPVPLSITAKNERNCRRCSPAPPCRTRQDLLPVPQSQERTRFRRPSPGGR